MMEDWKTYRLDELFEFSSGLSKPRSEFGSGYQFLSFKDVFYNYFVPDKLEELVNSTEKERKSCSVKRGDVFLTRTSETMGELGMSCVSLRDYEGATFNGFTKRLRPRFPERIVPEYAGYFFRSPAFRQGVTSMSSLSTRASLNNEMLGRLKMILPPVETQKAIGGVLKSLDDKIELNRRMNATLEAMARALFKAWFVDFEPVHANLENRPSQSASPEIAKLFPSTFENGIPKGWETKSISECCDVARGSSPRPIHDYIGDDIPWVKIADATRAGSFFIFETKEKIKASGKDKSVYLTKGSLILSNSATCGVPMFLEIEGCVHDGWLFFSNYRGITSDFLFEALARMSERLVQEADGTVQKNLNIALISRQPLIVPSAPVMSQFEKVHMSLFEKIKSNQMESLKLAEVRESLLPRLILGKLRVGDSETSFEMEAG